MLRSLIIVTALLPVTAIGRCEAQDAGLRMEFSALRTGAQSIGTGAAAATADSLQQSRLARDHASVVALFGAGMARLRLGELTAERQYLDDSQRLLDEAVYRAPRDWPWPWYGLAMADLALDSAGVVVKASMHAGAGVYYHDAALNALAKALEADSTFVPAAALLGRVLLPFGEKSITGELVRAVRRAAATNRSAEAWLALGRIHRNQREPDSAVASFRQYVAAGGDTAVGLLEQARSMLESGMPDSAIASYLAGADSADSLGRAYYRRDLSWVATPRELDAFDAEPPGELGDYVRQFWARRDAEGMRKTGERLAEHLRRWNYVFQHFELNGRSTGGSTAGRADCGPGIIPQLRDDPNVNGPASMPGLIGEAASPELQLFSPGIFAATSRGRRVVDDRGLIYMRHGEPDARASAHVERTQPWKKLPGREVTEATPVQTETRPNESWKYVTPDGMLLFHFCGSVALGTQAPTTLVDMLPLNPEMIGARSALDPKFAALEAELRRVGPDGRSVVLSGKTSNTASRLTEALVREGRHSLATGLATDGFPVKFSHPIDPQAQFFAVGRGNDGSGQVLVVFALPGDQLTPTPIAGGGVVYPVQFRLVASDRTERVARRDTTRFFRAADSLGPGTYLFGIDTLSLGAGTWDIRLLVAQPAVAAGSAIGRRGMTIPSGSELSLSDLVFGTTGSGLVWHSTNGANPLSPLDAYPRSGAVEVYYELNGAVPGHEYQTQIELLGVSGDAKGHLELGFTEGATGRTMGLHRSVALEPLRGGQYRMTVTVTDAGTGMHAARSRLLNVISRER